MLIFCVSALSCLGLLVVAIYYMRRCRILEQYWLSERDRADLYAALLKEARDEE